MDSAKSKLEFLDLTGASVDEIRHLEQVLSVDNEFQLPWTVETQAKSTPVPVEVPVEVEPVEMTQMPVEQPQPGEWVQQHYDGPMIAPVPLQHRPPMFQQSTPYGHAIYMPICPPAYPSQPYISPEMDQQRQVVQQRSMKKGDKKWEPTLMGPVQYVFTYPYPPTYYPIPVCQEFQPGFPQPNDPGVYQEEHYQQPHPMSNELQQPELKPEVNGQHTVPEYQQYEHLCYQAEVTLKAPKRRQPEESVPLQQVSAVEMPPVVAPPPTQHALTQPPSPAPIAEELPPTASTTLIPTQSIQDPPMAEPSARDPPTATSHEEIKDEAKESKSPRVRTDYPELQHATQAEPVHASSAPAGRSWAGLFVHSSAPADSKPRPLARVPPFESAASVPDASIAQHLENATPNMDNKDYVLNEDPYTVRLAESLRGYQLDHRAVSVTPRGLTNRSNWCYVNAILQALLACPSFFNLLKALPVPQDPKQAARTPIIGAMVELAQCFPPLAATTRNKRRDKHGREEVNDLPTGASFEPNGVYKVLDKVRGDSTFSVEGRQEDAEEFLSCLLNGLNDELFEVMKLAGATEAPVANGDVTADTDSGGDWTVVGSKNKGAVTRRAVCGKTPVSDIFRGQLRSRVHRSGEYVEYTDNVQPFFTLQLDVEKASSVKDALELLIDRDQLEGMTCSRTNQEVEAWTQTKLEDLPLILILHLKCFDYKHDGCSKITKTVDFTVDLKIEPKIMSANKKYSAKQSSYKLVAVVYHDGKEATKGHYITDAYHVGLASWIRYDDANVRPVREELVLKPVSPRVPYLLYYRRTDTMSNPRP